MLEGVRAPTQALGGKLVTAVEAAVELGLTVIASASLMQARLTTALPDTIRDHFPRCTTDAQRAIAFVRSIPGVTSALVGMRSAEHVVENLESATKGPGDGGKGLA
jgi:predicted aldo/keto reductase-like oxidoreductase